MVLSGDGVTITSVHPKNPLRCAGLRLGGLCMRPSSFRHSNLKLISLLLKLRKSPARALMQRCWRRFLWIDDCETWVANARGTPLRAITRTWLVCMFQPRRGVLHVSIVAASDADCASCTPYDVLRRLWYPRNGERFRQCLNPPE